MSSDLVKRLRDENADDLSTKAAARIEALEAEVATLKSEYDDLNTQYGVELLRIADEKVRVERLHAVLSKIANLDPSQEPWARTIARKELENEK
jgi:hypothetical protein